MKPLASIALALGVAGVALAGAVACSRGTGQGAAGGTATAASATAGTAAATATAADAVGTTTAGTTTAATGGDGAGEVAPDGSGAADATVVLRADGVAVRGPGASTTKVYRFGAARQKATVQAVRAAVPSLAVTGAAECGQGPRTQAVGDAFGLLFEDGVLVGWSDQGAPGRAFVTAQGVGVGSTQAELEAAYDGVEVFDGSLGRVWTEPSGLLGVFSQVAPGTSVAVIAAGETCWAS